ncbi:hypothetical protein [Paenisporosarcina quisquiliarum]|uniref:hypothetical protein n=1 Tax=Paenisporosarcina quisquiliarum TaxID=365346 RepID=UPI002426C8F4|nr:hypothetical protein [Bacillota bacterium]
MPLIPAESLPHFENMIYLPMVLTVLERDREIVEKGPFKLKRPYVAMIDQAVKEAQRELKDTKLYLRQKNMKIIRGNRDDTFTEYVFFYGGYEEHRRYLNVRLRNRVEELLGVYLVKMKQVN